MSSAAEHIAALEKKVGPAVQSPLFARLASLYLQSGRASDALKLCDKGLAHYPFYSTGHLTKGRALLALNMRAEARRELEIVLGLLPGNKMVQTLLQESPPSSEEMLTRPVEEAGQEPSGPESTEVPQTPVVPPTQPAEPPPDAFAGIMGFSPSTEPPAQEAPPVPAPSEPPAFAGFGGAAEATADAFGLGVVTPQEAPASEPVPAEEPPPASGFDIPPTAEASVFGNISVPGAGVEPPATQLPAEEAVFVGPGEAAFTGPGEEGTFEQYAARMRGELSGENTLSFDEYLAGVESATPAGRAVEAPRNVIEEITEKLQSAKKITPVINLAQKSGSSISDQDTAASMGFVTPTLAEIYAKQGWLDDAIKAYKTLISNKPADRERFEKRIAELEELKKQQPPE